ncbi:ATP-dependent endonuclease [Clostridium gelidum]|uniref:ATP-dependent endonuclease n=1 Tax=Clostridium gelidum TaxID=704125 RepID=A0ABM7T4I1_9CLOT|nr:AAA family ATPase [Clostridium gelidum]BCZ45815.1 ATP-dependent endonuclease [Clostridium gelidum]
MRISKIHIENFRSIKKQTIEDIKNALILIGKNNAGKSAIINAIRAFYGDLALAENDFYKGSASLEIEISFSLSDDYLKTMFYDSKVGFLKVPSSAAEYNKVKNDTIWAEKAFGDYKIAREEVAVTKLEEDPTNNEEFQKIWMKTLKEKYFIIKNEITICLKSSKYDCKVNYYINGKETKDIIPILPNVAFIDDDRNFSEEATGKSKTLTANIFNNIMINKIHNGNELTCKNCFSRDCKIKCMQNIYSKKIEELSISELEKLVNYKTDQHSEQVTKSITENFQKNYRSDYKISIQATSSIEKSFTLATKIFDPMLETEIDLANVGAGIRSIYILSLLQSYQKMMGKYCMFIIEEPELYLHPELQKSMANTLWRISESNQVIFTTHSPVMLKEFSTDEVRSVKIDLDKYETIIEKAELKVILNELGYASQDILHTDFILFLEGKDDLAALKEIINKYYNVDFNKILIIDTKSCQNIETYATLRFLNKTTMKSDFAIIRDADTMDRDKVKEKIINQMRENIETTYLDIVKKNIYVTEYSSMEGYFIDLDLLISERAFVTRVRMEQSLKQALIKYKQNHIEYFNDKNAKYPNLISNFETQYDTIIQKPLENIDWLKKNIRGHNLYGYLYASKIPLSIYVEKETHNAFKSILDFLDTIEYFANRKK